MQRRKSYNQTRRRKFHLHIKPFRSVLFHLRQQTQLRSGPEADRRRLSHQNPSVAAACPFPHRFSASRILGALHISGGPRAIFLSLLTISVYWSYVTRYLSAVPFRRLFISCAGGCFTGAIFVVCNAGTA